MRPSPPDAACTGLMNASQNSAGNLLTGCKHDVLVLMVGWALAEPDNGSTLQPQMLRPCRPQFHPNHAMELAYALQEQFHKPQSKSFHNANASQQALHCSTWRFLKSSAEAGSICSACDSSYPCRQAFLTQKS